MGKGLGIMIIIKCHNHSRFSFCSLQRRTGVVVALAHFR